ncbi:hypothetical protein [Oricola sp.]|uniref:hypothetical protein n=1 Tax=Oricola sp. TaxID=1979950 RepID=UPI003BAA96CA
MERQAAHPHGTGRATGASSIPVVLAISAGVALIGAVGMTGWLAHGNPLLLSVIQSGLSWCL